MKKIFYGVLVVALSLAFLSACDDAKKAQGETAVCTEGVDCAIVPPIQVKCYDITKVGFEKRMPLREPKRPLRREAFAKAATVERHFVAREETFEAKKILEWLDKEMPELADETAPLPISNRVSEFAKKKITDTFTETYDEANGGSIYTDGEFDPEAEYTIAPLERKAYLFQPEGQCFFIKAELEVEEEVVE